MALETWIMVGDAGGIEPACTDAPDGARPRGERKDALQESSTSSFCRRRRRRRLLGHQAAARSTQRHRLVAARARASWPDLGVRAQLHRTSARARALEGA